MKVLIIPEYFKIGGGTYTFLKKLIKLHYELDINTSMLLENNKRSIEIEKLCLRFNVELYYCSNRSKLFVFPYFSLLYELYIYLIYIRRIRHNILIISNVSVNLNLGYFINSDRVVFFTHSFPDKCLSILSSFMRIFTKFLNTRKQVVAVSKYAKTRIVNLMGFNSNYVNIIYNSFDKKYLDLIYNDKLNVVLTVGLMTPIKNPIVWLKVVQNVSSKLSNVKFVWIGSHSGQKDYLNHLAKQMNLDKYVELHEYTVRTKYFYNNASVYFQPSIMENHSISVVEAMSAGLPCVVSNVGGMPESVIEDKTGFLCDPSDVHSYSNRIIKLLNDRDLAYKLGFNGRIRAKRLFSDRVQKFKINRLYNYVSSNK